MLAVQVSYFDLLEKRRHNLETEKLGSQELAESQRHNVANEIQARNQLEETIRSNRANERLTSRSIGETQRHNVVSENENQRHNLATENLTQQQINATNRNIDLGYANLGENTRHNLATEAISDYNAKSQRISSQASKKQADTAKLNYYVNRTNANTNASRQALDYQRYMETGWMQGAVPGQTEQDRTLLGSIFGVSKILNEIIPF